MVLLDEIEKAHPDVFHLLLQVLEDGILTDSQGRKVDFSNTILIMTSNAGVKEAEERRILGFGDGERGERESWRESEMLSALKEQFRPEFLNRVDEIVYFRPLNRASLKRIAEKLLDLVVLRAKELGITLLIDPSLPYHLAERETRTDWGARPLRRAIVRLLEDPLATEILEGRVKRGDSILAYIKNDAVVFEQQKKSR